MGFLEFPSRGKLILYAAGGLLVAGVIIGALVFFGVGGGGGDTSDFEAEMEQQLAIDFAAVDATAEAEASITPEPTPTPAPTPDIGATQLASFEATRAYKERLRFGDPLANADKNPELTPAELEYLSDVGGAMWEAVGAWVDLRKLAYRDSEYWHRYAADATLILAEDALNRATDLLEQASDREDGVQDVVVGYVASLRDGVTGLQAARQLMADIYDTRREAREEDRELGVDERESLAIQERKVESDLAEFATIMSRYGCSICGEFFRRGNGGR